MACCVVKILFIIAVASNSVVVGNYQKDNSRVYDPPCFFNPLCICSKAYPDLGRVTCKNIPLLSIPDQINMSKVFTLLLENNGLRHIEPHFFRETGLFKIEISHNFLTEITEETFSGLERSLWELNLKHNRFKRVPSQSFRYLQKLKILDLSDNEISNVRTEDWLGLEDSLKTLILSGNKLSTVGPRTFSMLQQLEILDLSGNSLYEFDAFAFKDGPVQLIELHLADNLLSSIPAHELSELRELRYLDLSFNLISDLQDLSFDRSKKSVSLLLDTLKLDYNQIQFLTSESFKYFPTLNRTYLNGNPITYIEKDAFKRSKIRELFLKDCEISDLTSEAFSGLEDHLQVLDLEGNNLTTIPLNFFENFNFLKDLNLKDNFLKEIDSEKLFGGFQPTLQSLDVSGQLNSLASFQNFEKLPNLRSLTISKLFQTSLSADDILGFLVELEELKISYSNVKSLKNNAFKNVRGLRKLDLSENSIAAIENEAFAEISHSLVHLNLANAFSPAISQISPQVFEDLSSVEFLDLSNNKLRILPQKLFHSMKRLKVMQIEDNFVEIIPKRTFQGDIHSELHTIHFSFNQLSSIESRTFINLNKLENLWLNDNRITTIEKRGFMNLDKLKFLYLRGNKINLLKEESFQDLPELEKLDLAYNNLKTFNYDCLEQVGTLSSFTLNISHNNIEKLMNNLTFTDYPSFAVMHVNIKTLDLSHNNLSLIGPRYFDPIKSSLTCLDLSNNKLPNVTRTVFGNLLHLQCLDLSHNLLTDLEYDSFVNTKNIQVLDLSHNDLMEIPKNFFKGLNRLRILDIGGNEFRSFPDNLFSDGIIQKLDISDNRLIRIPINSFDADSAAVLSEFDLSHNLIVALPSPDEFSAFKNLYSLDLSKNRIIRLEDGIFSYLGRLAVLDLSHNSELSVDPKGQTFYGLDDTLEELILRNLSLNAIPALRLDSLRYLDLSDNEISNIPFEVSHNLSQIQRIELGGNEMVDIPPAINALNKLQYLGISGNPLDSIHFPQSFSLREIDIRNISLEKMEKGALGKLPLLQTIKLSINQENQNLNFPHLLKDNHGLNHLYIEVLGAEGSSLGDEMRGPFPPKLRNLTLAGHPLKTIPNNLLEGFQSPRLHLTLFNTSVSVIEEEVFENVKKIRNITLNLRSNRLNVVYNPNTGDSPNDSKKMFLLDLLISDNDWICDCSIGWIEGWERKRRQYLCDEDDSEDCFMVSEDFRSALCSNKQQPITVIEVFKQELECGWNSSPKLSTATCYQFLIISILIWFLNA